MNEIINLHFEDAPCRTVLNGQFQHSDLVKITAKDLQVVLLRN